MKNEREQLQAMSGEIRIPAGASIKIPGCPCGGTSWEAIRECDPNPNDVTGLVCDTCGRTFYRGCIHESGDTIALPVDAPGSGRVGIYE